MWIAPVFVRHVTAPYYIHSITCVSFMTIYSLLVMYTMATISLIQKREFVIVSYSPHDECVTLNHVVFVGFVRPLNTHHNVKM